MPRPGVPRGAQRTRGKAAEAGPADAPGGSERDYAWTCAQIRAGVDPEAMTETLAAAARARGKRRDEAAARQYAWRTVSAAASACRSTARQG